MLKFFEKTITVATLFYTTGAFLPFLTPRLSAYSGLSSHAIEFAIQSMFYLAAFCFIGLNWQRVLHSAWNTKWILALLLVALSSSAWSQDPTLTLRRAVVLCATTIFGIYFATRFEVPDQLRLLAWTFGLVVLLSFLSVIFLPHHGIDRTIHPGDWQGAFFQKNLLARAMVLSTFVFFFVKFKSGSVFRLMGILGSITLLVFSRSVTGLLVFAVILGCWPLYRLLQTRFTFAFPVIILVFSVLAGSATLAYQALPTLLEMINRDPGLTGRVELWNAVWASILRKPLLGYGFDAFWQGMQGESANILVTLGWTPAHAHNGFLTLLLDMGVLGLAVFVAGYFLLWRSALQLASGDGGTVSIWICTYLLFILIYNFTESAILEQNSIFWVLYAATAANLYLELPPKPAIQRLSWIGSYSRSDEAGIREDSSCA